MEMTKDKFKMIKITPQAKQAIVMLLSLEPDGVLQQDLISNLILAELKKKFPEGYKKIMADKKFNPFRVYEYNLNGKDER